MSRVYVGNIDPRVNERDLEDEFRVYGVIRSIWVARRPPGYAFIDFDDHRDAQDAIREMDDLSYTVRFISGRLVALATTRKLMEKVLVVLSSLGPSTSVLPFTRLRSASST